MKKVLVAIIFPVIVLSLSLLASGQAAPGSLDDQLTTAASNGDTALVQQLLEKGAHIEAKNAFGNPALVLAAYRGYTEVVKLLLEKGANIEATVPSGNTSLIIAAANGRTEVVKLLLGERANIEAKGEYGMTALMLAAREGQDEVVKLLLERGANIEAKNSEGRTALMFTAYKGKVETANLLLEKGANIEAKDNDGRTELNIAASDGKADVVNLLLEKRANIEAKATQSPYEGYTPLLCAADAGKTEVVKLLLDKGANIEAMNSIGWTALMKAAIAGYTDVVKVLLDRGANIEAKVPGSDAHEGTTALLVAAQAGKSEVVKLLLDRGANIEAKDNYGRTALALALAHTPEDRKTEVVQLLEQRGTQNPLTQQLVALQHDPSNEALRHELLKAAAGLQSLPAVPEQARQLARQASALIKQTSSPQELGKPIAQLEEALMIAPWWGNAYYNLSRALELSGSYDEAVKQLSYYLELKPSEAEATEARAHISVIWAEKETVASKQQEKKSSLAVKYVSGGATRLRWFDSPAWWRPREFGGIATLYTYMVPEEAPFYANVFRMPNGRFLTITLVALSNNGTYAGDQIGVADITEESCKGRGIEGQSGFTFGAQGSAEPCGFPYNVSVSNPPNAIVTVTYTPTGASVTIPVALLYRGRVRNERDGKVYQGGKDAKVLTFDSSVVRAAEDPNVNAMGLTPTSVTPQQSSKK